MLILGSKIFYQFPEISFCFSTKLGLNRKPPFYFNTSLSVGDNENLVKENREYLYSSIGLTTEQVAIQKQIHSDIVTYVDKGGVIGESDAMITDKPKLGLAISTADCTPIFIYDKKNKIIAAVHSGWRGTVKEILSKTLLRLKNDFNAESQNLYAYIGLSICQEHYEVGKEVAEKFDEKYLQQLGEKYILDVSHVNYDILLNFGIPSYQIGKSNLCTYDMKYLLHSYRRDGQRSGRALGVIAIKQNF